jgi:single-strand DNA-binding protein
MATTITIVGNLTEDPEVRFTPNGAAVCNFQVAVTPRLRDGDTWRDGETSFYPVSVWRAMAENVAESLSKGARVIVTGRLEERRWETPEGQRRSRFEITADEVAPSLKFATAEVSRKSGSSGNGRDPGPRKPGSWDEPPPF